MSDKRILGEEFPLKFQNITAASQSIVFDVRDANSGMLTMTTANAVGHNSSFQWSTDGVNYFPMLLLRTNSAIIESSSGLMSATPAYGWELSLHCINFLKVTATAHTSGTATWSLQQSAFASEGNPVVQLGSVISTNRAVSTGGTNATLVKNAPCVVSTITSSNEGASAAYLKIYNKASVPNVGVDQPVAFFLLPAGQEKTVNFGAFGEKFDIGFSYAITGAAAYTDTTVIAANQVRTNIGFM